MKGVTMTTVFQSFQIDELERNQTTASGPYIEFLRRSGMSVGLYVLPVGGKDQQHPHAADEVYIVLRGRATLRVEDHDEQVGAGSVVSVDHGVDHRFVDIEEDLHILVVFAPPETPDD
jgi:mannose-6-phosphate isomerase-like protein (cupin superfamily)